MKRPLLILFIIITGTLSGSRLNAQRPIAVEELPYWKRITDRGISDDGKWVSAVVSPWDGDSSVWLFNAKGRQAGDYSPADRVVFSPSSEYALIRTVPAQHLTDSLKLAKTKKDKMPMNGLVIRRLAGGEEEIDSVKSYKVSEHADWLAYQRTEKDKTLRVRTLDGSAAHSFPEVTEFGFSPKSARMYYLTEGDTLGTAAGLYMLDLEDGSSGMLKEGKEVFKSISWSKEGDRIAFLHCQHKDSVRTGFGVWYSDGGEARRIVSRGNRAIPEGWVVSQNGSVNFSRDGKRIFFGTAPEERQRDTTVLAEKYPEVHVWSWNEPVQYTVQEYNRRNDMKRSYRAVYNTESGTTVQLASPELPEFAMSDEGNGELGLLSTTEPYSLSSMWEYRTARDIYTVSLETGEKKRIAEAFHEMPRFSPTGKYLWGYSRRDSSWMAMELASGRLRTLTSPDTFAAWDEQFDMPDLPTPYGTAGWTENDEYMLIYDRYDIWRFDPRGEQEPVNLTVNGRSNGITYRYIRLDREERFIDVGRRHLLSGFDNKTKSSGIYEAGLSAAAAPKALVTGSFRTGMPLKAKKSDAVLYTKESFTQFPELLLTDMKFKKSQKLTDLGSQQKGVRWGTAELVSWTSLDGKRIEGLLYKPDGFDPKKKYPMLVNFYERSSDDLYRYHTPQPGRSTIDYPMYLSQGYVIFNPDVVYDDGYPGQSCYNCVMPGITRLIEQGFIDEKAIGAQGHSWGGYQVAYLATRTDLFAAIESGAPVVNMFSAYGGIRWGSGMARAFQYEHTQSRIGGSPWSAPREFIENSPLFQMDKVHTPILIMHNDQDGHVPWYQGIEYFVALKRLGKPAWMLNYTGEIHWPGKMANRIDFQKRMFQFFDHYLKGSPMPKWMSEGVRAVDRDFELGYEQ